MKYNLYICCKYKQEGGSKTGLYLLIYELPCTLERLLEFKGEFRAGTGGDAIYFFAKKFQYSHRNFWYPLRQLDYYLFLYGDGDRLCAENLEEAKRFLSSILSGMKEYLPQAVLQEEREQ